MFLAGSEIGPVGDMIVIVESQRRLAWRSAERSEALAAKGGEGIGCAQSFAAQGGRAWGRNAKQLLRGGSMKKLIRRRPSAAMIIAVIALVAAIGGTAVAGGGFLTKKKFNKFKGSAVTGLTYVNNTQSIPNLTTYTHVSASCPAGMKALGGGVKLTPSDPSFWWGDGYLTTTGYAADVFNGLPANAIGTAIVTVACANASSTTAPAAS